MADNYSKLLMYIVDHQIMSNESRESEIEATATRDVDAEIASVAQDMSRVGRSPCQWNSSSD